MIDQVADHVRYRSLSPGDLEIGQVGSDVPVYVGGPGPVNFRLVPRALSRRRSCAHHLTDIEPALSDLADLLGGSWPLTSHQPSARFCHRVIVPEQREEVLGPLVDKRRGVQASTLSAFCPVSFSHRSMIT